MSISPWRVNLQPASYNGAEFKVDVDAKASGRRDVTHEFPKKDTPYTEDMGRRAKRFTITAYVIGPNYTFLRDALEAELESEGPGLLVHPTRGEEIVNPGPYSVRESREKGGFAEFE